MNWFKIAQNMIVYRVGNPSGTNFYVTDKDSLQGWLKYLGDNLPIQRIEASLLYIPNTNVSFSSWQELQSLIDENPSYESNIFPEESGLQHLTQFEVRNELV